MKPGPRVLPILIVVLVVALTVLIAGCAASPTTSAPPAVSAGASVTPPTIKVLAPSADAVIKGADLDVRIETTGLEFVDPSNTVVPGQGHVHFTLDQQPVEMSVTPDYAFKGLAPGPHTLRAELVQNDTKPFAPAVFQTVTFTVE